MKHRGTSWSLAALVGMTWLSATACGGSRKSASQPKADDDAIAATSRAPSPPVSAGESTVEVAPHQSMTLAASVEKTSPVEKVKPVENVPPAEKAVPSHTQASTAALRSLTMSESRATIDPSTTIPSPPAKMDTAPRAGIDAAIKAVPSSIPMEALSQSALEGPLRDRARFDHCRIPRATRGEISAVIYNGAALEADVKTEPEDRALNFCIERTVRQMTWVKDLTVNKVKVPF